MYCQYEFRTLVIYPNVAVRLCIALQRLYQKSRCPENEHTWYMLISLPPEKDRRHFSVLDVMLG